MTVNARSSGGNITGQLFIGNDEVVARNQKFSIKTDHGKNILYADKDKIHFAADKLEFLSKYFFPSWPWATFKWKNKAIHGISNYLVDSIVGFANVYELNRN